MQGSATTIGVVIRTLNESGLIGRCLDTLSEQRGDFDLDVLVVDSGSTDETVEIARSRKARVVNVPPGEFDYSKALNLGFEQIRGDLVLSLSAHAIPVDEQWLERMVRAADDPRVAGVMSRQVPWPDAPWREVYRLERQFPSHAWVADGELPELIFSNAAALIRRRAWQEHPFTLRAAEDLDWAQRVLAAGWSVVYEPQAAVYHSHDESPREQAARMIDLHRVADPEAERRPRRRTLREAAGIFVRDSRKILGLDEPLLRKLAYLIDLAQMAFYYVLDFSWSGTTAERRRRAAGDSSRSNSEVQGPA